ncbi:MAG: NADPH-dependent glutamate synthase [Endomicrobium sp.]|jgi:glutamate synthase (NADPH/NADH) small chain|nr:NADPH-dependent glutamate synthase [Endomicrobium sp.]
MLKKNNKNTKKPTLHEMLIEAKKCLQCKNPPCIKGCPIEVNIPMFIKYFLESNLQKAIKIIKQKNNFPTISGIVCPQEKQCEKFCILNKKNNNNMSVSIGNLEYYIASSTTIIEPHLIKNNKKNIKIAIIGSGPAGLTCTYDLLKVGYDVTVYESLHSIGGVLRYGIPEFRLPKKILEREINNLKKLGMNIVLNTFIGRTKSLQELFDDGYKSIFIATGAGLPVLPKISGENLNHIYSSNEFLVRINLMHSYKFPNYDTPIYKGKNVVVIGGGNTAIDSSRTILRSGVNNVKLIYRKSENEMSARKEGIFHAKHEGVEFITLTELVKFIGDENGNVKAIECVKNKIIMSINSNEKQFKKIVGSNHIIKTDMVILALGLHPNPTISLLSKKINTDSLGYVIIDDNFMTSISGVFAGGDIVGGSTVIEAMGMAKKAAKAIVKFIC